MHRKWFLSMDFSLETALSLAWLTEGAFQLHGPMEILQERTIKPIL